MSAQYIIQGELLWLLLTYYQGCIVILFFKIEMWITSLATEDEKLVSNKIILVVFLIVPT